MSKIWYFLVGALLVGCGDDKQVSFDDLSPSEQNRYVLKSKYEALGDYFSWLSHDDVYSYNKIEKQIEAIYSIRDKDALVCCGCVHIDKNSKLVLNHFSHNGINSTYTEFVPIAAENGFEVSYDGMEIDV